MKKAVVLTCFESNEEPAILVTESFKSLGFETLSITTNYSHIRKSFRTSFPSDFRTIETLPYKKNMSIDRLRSHAKFAKDAFELIEKYNPDLIYVLAPAHSLIKEAKKYKNKYPKTKVIIHIIDMWPESLPIGKIKTTLPFRMWRNIRTKNIDVADYLVSECDLYREILSKEYDGNIQTIHWARNENGKEYKLNLPLDKLSLAYIGSINNIIDIDEIKRLVESADKPVELHIIGDGENKDEMLKKLEMVSSVKYYGSVYDPKQKEVIFSKCHAGLNIYKKNLYIGLTVKSIDYLRYGLPIINTIKGDTYKMIEEHNIGLNDDGNIKLQYDVLNNMRLNSKEIINLYNKEFTSEVFENKCKEVINKVINK